MARKKAAKKKEPNPEVNIGLVGHVDHGKTTLVKALSGKWTDTHSEEIKRGITIRLGYADATFYKCSKCETFSVEPKCPECKSKSEFVRKVSFVDAPGHESLMATMLSGSNIMDGALLLISATEDCPQPQTREHLMALEITGIENVIVVQNKIDLVSEEKALANYKEIKEFLKGTEFENAPVIPISAQHNINVDLLIAEIQKIIPTPKRDPKKDPVMYVARSFDINKPGSDPVGIKGGVLGGTLKQGILKTGQEIEILPGHLDRSTWKPINTKIVSLMTGSVPVDEVTPGGSIAILTSLDPSIVKSDKLSGAVAGIKGKLPPVWHKFNLETHLLDRVVGSKTETEVEPIKKNEILMLNAGSSATVGFVTDISKNKVECNLKLPVCAEVGSRVTISRRIGNRFRLIGYGLIVE